jgi:hypothetical protein
MTLKQLENLIEIDQDILMMLMVPITISEQLNNY